MLGLLAETPVHSGTGRGVGVVDLPVAREASTDYPVLVGSSLKGALRDKANQGEGADVVDSRFGKPDHAGDLLTSDARLLLLPVRSLTGQYRWATCPHLIERYGRDLARAKHTPPPTPAVEAGSVLAAGEGELFLEERQFDIAGQPSQKLIASIGQLILHDETRERLNAQLAILCNDDFSWFARYGLTIQARNTLDDNTKQSTNLWYEETLPPDTVMHSLILGRNSDAIEVLNKLFPEEDPYLQVGGNETVGQGWFAVKVASHSAGGGQ